MSNTINGRTPEEIKHGLEYCISESVLSCDECPYAGKPCDGMQMFKDALAYIQQLEAERDQYKRERDEARNDLDTLSYANTELHSAYEAMKRERDAAVEQLKEVDRVDLFRCSHCAHDELCNDGLTSCIDCDKDCPCRTCEKGGNWQWRGVQEEVKPDEQIRT